METRGIRILLFWMAPVAGALAPMEPEKGLPDCGSCDHPYGSRGAQGESVAGDTEGQLSAISSQFSAFSWPCGWLGSGMGLFRSGRDQFLVERSPEALIICTKAAYPIQTDWDRIIKKIIMTISGNGIELPRLVCEVEKLFSLVWGN